MSTDIDSARRDWEDGHRQLLATAKRDRRQTDNLYRQLDTILAELRRRIGSVFTLAELVAIYPDSERWVRLVVEESDPPLGWARSLAMTGDAAFYLYARGAQDYTP